MNWPVTILLVLLLGLVGFIAFDERSQKKEKATVVDSLLIKYVQAESKRLRAEELLAAGEVAAQRGAVDLQRVVNEAVMRLRSQPVIVQYRGIQDRLVAGKLLTPADTVSGRKAQVVSLDSIGLAAIATAIIQGDTAKARLSICEAALGSTQKALSDTTSRLNKLDGAVGVWADTKGMFSGKNKRLKRAYRSLKPP